MNLVWGLINEINQFGRLAFIRQGLGETLYRFDPASNREMLPSSANPNQWYEEISLREVRHNRLRQDKDFHYIYDNFGNRIQTLPAPYNNESFPTAQPVNSGNRHEYRYDAQQRLVAFWITITAEINALSIFTIPLVDV